MKKPIKLELLVWDYDMNTSNSFIDNNNCPVATAAKRYFDRHDVMEFVSSLQVGTQIYLHKQYSKDDFIIDHRKIESYDDSVDLSTVVVRTILLYPQEYFQ